MITTVACTLTIILVLVNLIKRDKLERAVCKSLHCLTTSTHVVAFFVVSAFLFRVPSVSTIKALDGTGLSIMTGLPKGPSSPSEYKPEQLCVPGLDKPRSGNRKCQIIGYHSQTSDVRARFVLSHIQWITQAI